MCMYACEYIYMYVYIYIYMYRCIYIHVYIHNHMCVRLFIFLKENTLFICTRIHEHLGIVGVLFVANITTENRNNLFNFNLPNPQHIYRIQTHKHM